MEINRRLREKRKTTTLKHLHRFKTPTTIVFGLEAKTSCLVGFEHPRSPPFDMLRANGYSFKNLFLPFVVSRKPVERSNHERGLRRMAPYHNLRP
jgi:hypothetical protein